MKIRVKNWSDFQHYRDRNPPWIKLHRRLLNDREFFLLDGECVKTLVLLWMLAAETKSGELPAIEDIAFRLRLDSKVLSSQIVKLNHWLIVDASNALADCEQVDSNLLHNSPPETETETETIDPSLRSGSTQDHVSTSEDFSLSSSITCKHSETRTKTKSKTIKKSKTKTKTDGSKVWESYSSAYEKRYGTLPVRNAKTNALCARFVELVGADSAPEVAAYYLTSRNAWYVQRGHNLESLVADAGKLHTEWATGNRITHTRAREDDRLQETGDMWQRIIDKYGE